MPGPEKIDVQVGDLPVKQLLADTEFTQYRRASCSIKSSSARLINRIIFRSGANGKFIESTRMDHGVAAHRIAGGYESSCIGQIIPKKEGVAVCVTEVFGLDKKDAGCVQACFRLRKNQRRRKGILPIDIVR